MNDHAILVELAKILITSILGGGIATLYLKRRINLAIDERIQRSQNQKETFSKFLESWYSRRDDHNKGDWTKEFGKVSKDVLLWCPNEVLHHLGRYIELYGQPEAKIHLGNAVICFRKTLGYKNHWWQRKKVTAKHIVDIYSVGNEGAAD